MRINDYLINKKTGYVFQIIKIKNNIINFIKVGDSLKLEETKNYIEDNYRIVEYMSNEGEKIHSIRKQQVKKGIDNYIKFDDSLKNYTSTTNIPEDSDLYDKLENHLESLLDKDNFEKEISKVNERMVKDIQDMSDDEFKNKNKIVEDEKDKDIEFNIIEPTERDLLENIFLNSSTKEKIDQALTKYELSSIFEDDWKLETVENTSKAMVLNLFGPPGTGKTISARAIAKRVNKSILKVDFAELVSKWVGETGKNIKKYFQKAKEKDLILFFDEADTLIQKRSSSGDSNAHHMNQNQNIFMQELDSFEGIVILTTNLFENYDPALLRRITSIKYPLPDKDIREKIFTIHLPKKVNFGDEVSPERLALLTEGFSGGDIKNIVENTLLNMATKVRNEMKNKSLQEIRKEILSRKITLDFFESEINYIKLNKESYEKKESSNGSSKKIGIVA